MNGAVERGITPSQIKGLEGGAGKSPALNANENFEARPHPAGALLAWSATQPAPVRNAAVIVAQNLRLARRYPNSAALRSVLSLQIGGLARG